MILSAMATPWTTQGCCNHCCRRPGLPVRVHTPNSCLTIGGRSILRAQHFSIREQPYHQPRSLSWSLWSLRPTRQPLCVPRPSRFASSITAVPAARIPSPTGSTRCRNRSTSSVVHDARAAVRLPGELIARTVEADRRSRSRRRGHPRPRYGEAGGGAGWSIARRRDYAPATRNLPCSDTATRCVATCYAMPWRLGARASPRPMRPRLPRARDTPSRSYTGEPANVKITTERDLEAAQQAAGDWPAPAFSRAGTGYDLHRLVAGRRLVLARR